MKKLIISLVAILGLGIAASANNYTIDESAIDAMIENAVEVSPMAAEASAAAIQDVTLKFGSAPQPIVAFVLSVIPVTGWLAVHRMYLGTSPLAVILNIVTGGGFGIVYVVDWVVLLMGVLNNNIKDYVNNGRWWMWANII
ncbi:MAG: TM2 domain-containing protein [Candidatus Cryptobacteroides sp.]